MFKVKKAKHVYVVITSYPIGMGENWGVEGVFKSPKKAQKFAEKLEEKWEDVEGFKAYKFKEPLK
jgi:hypothetical protein